MDGQHGGPIEAEIAELQHKVQHLLRSNDELRRCIAEAGPDREYKVAIEDNIVTIARFRARIASLEEQLRAMKRGGMDIDSQANVSGGAWL